MTIIAPPQRLYEILLLLLQERRCRYLRYRHLRAALQSCSDVSTALSIGAGRGVVEVALGLEFPEIQFTIADAPGAAAFKEGRSLAKQLGLKNVTFRELDIMRVPRSAHRYDFVSSVEVLQGLADVGVAAANMRTLSRRWTFALVPFANELENRDPGRRHRALTKHGHKTVGFDASGLLRLFPRAVALRGCYWRDAGAKLRERLDELDDAAIGEHGNELLALGEVDVRPGWPGKRGEATGIWVLEAAEVQAFRWPIRFAGSHSSASHRWEPIGDRRLIELSGLFDAEYYASSNSQCVDSGLEPIEHYLKLGAPAGLNPYPEFDSKTYCQRAGIDPAKTNPLAHFLSEGRSRGISPVPAPARKPGGSGKATSAANSPQATVASDSSNPTKDGDTRIPLSQETERVHGIIAASGLFDAAYYLRTNSDVRARGLDPLEHYIRSGAREGRRANRLFDSAYYASAAGIDRTVENPLVHYITHGEQAGLRPSQAFDPAAYKWAFPDAKPVKGTLLAHHLGRVRSNQQANAGCKDLRSVDVRSVRVTIVVPVYNAADEVRRCIESIAAETRTPLARLLVIDDASPDPSISELLDSYSNLRNVTVVRNDTNLGFTRTVNRGIKLSGDTDVVLLNSDTVVGPRWLEELILAAYAEDRTATATAISDNAGAFSTPKAGPNATHELVDVPTAARLTRRIPTAPRMPVPTGNGFCMYVRRSAIDEVGLLDSARFPRGYGEENDWCLRATEQGWRHVIALRAYVAHVNAASFGEGKATRILEARQVLDSIHPDYSLQLKRSFGEESVLARQRPQFRRAIGRHQSKRAQPRILYVTSTTTGGTPQTNADLMDAVSFAFEPMLLICDSHRVSLFDASMRELNELEHHELREHVSFLTHTSAEYERVVFDWLVRYDVEVLHVRHIAWHSLALPRIAAALGIRVVYSFHDFYSVCPSVNLIAGHGPVQWSGVVDPEICAPLWEQKDPESVKVARTMEPRAFLNMWQRRMNVMLSDCDALVTTDGTVRDTLAKNLSAVSEGLGRFFIIPHGRDFRSFMNPPQLPGSNEPLRLLVAGNINEAKGMQTLLELIELDEESRFEVHLIGNSRNALRECPRVHSYGPYDRESFAKLVESIRPHVSLILSICPESFCHTLTESWAAGLPVVGSKLGAVGARLADSGAGWIVDPLDARGLYVLLTDIAANQSDFEDKCAAVIGWQKDVGTTRTTRAMANEYVAVYRRVFTESRTFGTTRGVRSRPRVALVAQRHFPLSPATVHVRLATAIRASNGKIDYDWVAVDELVRGQLSDFDGVLVCRNAGTASQLDVLASLCKAQGIPVVVDLDDDLLNVPQYQDPNSAYTDAIGGLRSLMQVADVVTLATPELVEKYRDRSVRLQLVENRLDAKQWFDPVPAASQPPEEWAEDARLRVLYAGSGTHQEDLSLVLSVFEQLQDRGIILHVVGVEAETRPGYRRIAVPEGRYDRFVPWLRSIAPHFDVAIVPLVDSDFNRCKSPLKFMEFAACALPVVASDVAPYSRTIQDGVDGLLAADAASFGAHLVRLLEEPALRQSLAVAASARAKREFVCRDCVFDAMRWRGRSVLSTHESSPRPHDVGRNGSGSCRNGQQPGGAASPN